MQGEIGFPRLGAPRAPPPSQVELVNRSRPASRPRHLPSPRPLRAPGQVKVARGADAWRGRRELGEQQQQQQQASADPGPVTCGERGPSPASLPFSRPAPLRRRPASEDPAARPQPLELVTTGGGGRAGEGPRRQGSGRPRAAGSPGPT